ncbi:MAG TPA: Jag N-terminal domain-containing protein [Candidatus Hydrothermia bacterium]|nr:KH domain-containing protein [Candidatus Hydrothermae bacterium]MDD3649649.1 Jag N-terminal domain-containing protein [Candidatus Hydrothermia bacterium]MDD5572881.1 Jag N-terminal domain-containing protein [Candidatus Hydrothermia bacterium]HOK23559.1 Jag N-terminal domain-containing protein [Candidatus Hydrothermia bacterium]HOL24292.1 Jag N-terminal domain-containing protein [Candidatus Hydrothermia bacterium]
MEHERFVDVTGNSIEECIEKAINELGIEKHRLRFIVLNDGIQAKPAKIRVCLKPEEVETIEDVLKKFFGYIDIRHELEIIPRDKRYSINVNMKDPYWLIGKGGQNLDNLEYILNLIIRRKLPDLSVRLDINNFRKRKEEVLKNKALAVVARVKELKKEMRFDPVNEEEWRILRDFLKDIKDIKFYSVKEEDKTILVIAPK